jgi:methionyl-tRNA synthetase
VPKFYLTTPIYYVNARPHLGHTYTTVVADAIARYKRMRGFEVVLLTGTDEHGQKVERAARAAGVAPQEYADRISAEYRRLWDELDLKYDRFVRTTEDRHERSVHNLLLKARDNGYVYQGHYEGQYCVFDEMYVDEPLEGGLCPECKRPTERIREENYFFKLSVFQDRLLELYEKHPEFVQPETRRNEVMAFVRGGLRDLSISRSRTQLRWGIPFPEDDRHVIYVWYDALTSYMTGVGYGDDELQWEKYWPADLHLIGKEIIRFHCVYWPAFLMAAFENDEGGAQAYLPKNVFAHGWWVFAGEKMSKSRGNIALPQPIARVLGIDALRYFLLREMVFGQDGNFSYEALVQRYNSDLVNDLGNLAKRTLDMIERYCGGEVPHPLGPAEQTKRDIEVAEAARNAIGTALGQYDRYEFSRALESIWGLVAEINKYLVENEPWALAEDPSKRSRLATTLYTAAESLRVIAALASPVIPHSAQKVWQQLGLTGELEGLSLDQLAWGQLQPGTRIGTPKAIFPRVKKDETLEKFDTIEQEISGAPQPVPAAPLKETKSNMITIEDFTKVEMKVGEVKSAEKIAGADKLLKVLVDVGDEVRQVVAGIAEVYKPEELVGRKVIVVTNLQPRKLRGVESNGMIVAASVGPEGKPVLAGFLEDVPPGAKLK